MSTTVGDTRSARLRTVGARAQGALPTARVAAFAGAQADASKATGAIGLSLVTVSGALADWAEALETAQQAVRGASQRHEKAETSWRRARSLGEPDLQQQYHQDMVDESDTADRAHRTLDDARRRAVAALRGEVDLWVPDQSSLSPVKAWQRAAVGAAPASLTLDAGKLLEAYRDPDVELAQATLTHAIKGGTKGYQLYSVLNYLRAPALARKAEQKYLEARNVYQALKGAAPDLSDPAVYKAYLKAERAALKGYMSDAPAEVRRAQWLYKQSRGLLGDVKALERLRTLNPSLSTAEIVGTAGRFDKLTRPLRALSPLAGKVLGPLGVVTGGIDVYTAITDHSMATDDRVALGVGGAATAIGGGATALMAFGLVATGPVGLTVVAVAGVVAVGAWVYQNREAIADGAKKVGGAIASGAKAVGGAVADGAKKVWKGLFG
ncbi:hypothetical protein [Cellulomonas sp. HZM]|uniref:hypothetical protein n=1 Tax=Cellulomonas sp. HZM TaxID=1454010 RepID=UPI0012DECE33|nr:hypothetical protein [Cellulomonas sp. HZM]